MMNECCLGCTKRFVGCHGKNEDGSWRCEDWRKEQEAKEAEYERTRSARLESAVVRRYVGNSIQRHKKMKERHLRR